MASINIDGNKLVEYGSHIKTLTQEYDLIVNDLMNRMINIFENAWSGNVADRFSNRVFADKIQYKELSNNLELYAKVLIETGDLINNTNRKWEMK